MKIFSVFLLAISTLLANAATVSISDLPTCALLCLETEILASVCAPTNTTCTCTNAPLVSAITMCVSMKCTVKQALVTKAYTEQNCGAPIRNNAAYPLYTEVIGYAIVIVTYVLRMYSKFNGAGGKLGMDDLFITFAVMLATPLCILASKLVKHGLGRDIYTLDVDDIYYFAKLFVADELLYLASLPVIKISILFFYLRIFQERRLRIWVYITMGICVAYGIAFELVSIFQCQPISGAWTAWDGTFQGHCNDINLQGWMSAAINIVLDLVVIILPLPELWQMNMSMQKKISIMVMFCVGFFVTVVSILRLECLIKFGGTENPSYDYVSVVMWSTIEKDVSVICACMPALRALFKQTFPNALKSTAAPTTNATPKYPLISFGSRKNDLESGTSSKPKIKDVDDFVPLVDWEPHMTRSQVTIEEGGSDGGEQGKGGVRVSGREAV